MMMMIMMTMMMIMMKILDDYEDDDDYRDDYVLDSKHLALVDCTMVQLNCMVSICKQSQIGKKEFF